MSVRQFPPLCVCKREPLFLSAQLHLPVQLIENSMRCFRQYRRNEDCDNAQRLYYLVENFGEMRGFVLLFSEQPAEFIQSPNLGNVSSQACLGKNLAGTRSLLISRREKSGEYRCIMFKERFRRFPTAFARSAL